MGFTTAKVVAEQRSDIIKVSTGCKELDEILEGVVSKIPKLLSSGNIVLLR